jgi:hypothetical protein
MDFDDSESFLDCGEDDFEDVLESQLTSLAISSYAAQSNYEMAGRKVPEEEDQISIATYGHLLNDEVHNCLMEVLNDVQLPYKLSDFQLLSLHVLGSGKHLMLISPTGNACYIY